MTDTECAKAANDPAMIPTTYPAVQAFLDRHVLAYIDDHDTNGFDWLAFNLRPFTNDWITRDMASAICKSLRDRGYLTYERGLWTEGGEPAGSGYAIHRLAHAHCRHGTQRAPAVAAVTARS